MAKKKFPETPDLLKPEKKEEEIKKPIDPEDPLNVSEEDPDKIPDDEDALENPPPYEPPPPGEGP